MSKTRSLTSKSLLLLTLLFLTSFQTSPVSSSTSCSKATQCGSNIKYKACIGKECHHCIHNKQCNINDGDICHNDGMCTMHGVEWPMTINEIFAAIAVLIGSMIAAGGGLGGGGVFVPIFILITGFDPKSAAALSQATIFGGSIVNLIMNFREQHPIRKHRTLADLPTVLILAPLLLGGAVMGVILNQIMPDPIIVILMIVILAYAAFRTFNKGIRLWKQENLARQEAKLAYDYQNQQKRQQQQESQYDQDQDQSRQRGQSDNGYDSLRASQAAGPSRDAIESFDKQMGDYPNAAERIEYPNMRTTNSTNNLDARYKMNIDQNDNLSRNNSTEFLISESGHSQASNAPWLSRVAKQAGQDSTYLQMKLTQRELHQLEKLMHQESQIFKPMIMIFIVWCIVSIFSLLRSTTIIVDLQCGSITYWIVVCGIYPCLMFITYIIAKKEVESHEKKLSLYWMPYEGDIEWNGYRAILYPLIAMIAGLLGGLLGIGGGMIVSPLLFELGVLPRVAAATSAIAVMITASSSILQKYLEDMIRTDWMITYIIVGIIGTFIGQTLFNHLVRKYNRTSFVVFAVSTIIGLAVILMGIDGVVDSTWNFEFVPLC